MRRSRASAPARAPGAPGEGVRRDGGDARVTRALLIGAERGLAAASALANVVLGLATMEKAEVRFYRTAPPAR